MNANDVPVITSRMLAEQRATLARTARYAGPLSAIPGPLALTDAIIAYEEGELDEDAIARLFQALVDNGMAWRLQGAYGRMAVRLIEAGLVVRPGNR